MIDSNLEIRLYLNQTWKELGKAGWDLPKESTKEWYIMDR